MCYVNLFLVAILCLLTSQKLERFQTQEALISFQISSYCLSDLRENRRQINFPGIVYSSVSGTDHFRCLSQVSKHFGIDCVAQAGKFTQVFNKGTCPGKAGMRSLLLFKDFTGRPGACNDTFSPSPGQVLKPSQWQQGTTPQENLPGGLGQWLLVSGTFVYQGLLSPPSSSKTNKEEGNVCFE